MPTTFSRSMRSLERDRFTLGGRLLAGALVLLAAWGAWLALARVGVYVSSERARLEVGQAVHPVQARVAGVVVGSRLALGDRVAAGDTLVVLDADIERDQLQEERARLDGYERQIAALRGGAAAGARSQSTSGSGSRLAVDEARARLAEAESAARFAEDEAGRLAALGAGGNVAALEVERARAIAQQRRLAVDARRSDLERLERDSQTDRTDRQVDLQRIDREIAELEGAASAARATIARLEREIDRRVVRAGASGVLGEAVELQPGAVVDEGTSLGAIVPDGDLRMIASFPPPTAFGRIAPGQHARLRLAGFPWTQFGSVAATVKTVGSEVRDGVVRVELALDDPHDGSIPLQHGLPGSVEIEVERIAPAALLLRTVGVWLTDGDEPETSR